MSFHENELRLSLELFRDISYLELALRNHIDKQFCKRWQGNRHWLFDSGSPIFLTENKSASYWKNKIAEANKRAKTKDNPSSIISDLPFGFWTKFSEGQFEQTLWIPYVRHAFAKGASRKYIDRGLSRIRAQRNRIAHHEPLNLGKYKGLIIATSIDVLSLLDSLNPNLAEFVKDTSKVRELLQLI
jgi:hypothetical protein